MRGMQEETLSEAGQLPVNLCLLCPRVEYHDPVLPRWTRNRSDIHSFILGALVLQKEQPRFLNPRC
jgi:hypothetical protein